MSGALRGGGRTEDAWGDHREREERGMRGQRAGREM